MVFVWLLFFKFWWTYEGQASVKFSRGLLGLGTSLKDNTCRNRVGIAITFDFCNL